MAIKTDACGRQGRWSLSPNLRDAKVFSILSSAQENIYSKASEMHILKTEERAYKRSTSEIVGPCSPLLKLASS